VLQKAVAGSAAFQAAGVAVVPIRGYHLALPPTGTRGSRQDAGAPLRRQAGAYKGLPLERKRRMKKRKHRMKM